MDEADRCDRVAILDGGKLVAAGTPASLKERVGGDVITLSTRDAAAVQKTLREKLSVQAAEAGDGVVRFERPRGHEFVPAIFEALPPGLIESISVGKPTLEDVFIDVTGHRFVD